jgi:hypothetical protein
LDRMFVRVSQIGNILTPEQGIYNHLWAVSAPPSSIKQGLLRAGRPAVYNLYCE